MSNHGVKPAKRLAFRPVKPDNLLVKLFSVTITHGYYTLNDLLCPDFTIAPTPSSVTLMSALGMAFRLERCGFTVFIEQGRRARLLARLAKNMAEFGECWERLTFSMCLKNPLFVSITALPIDTRTTQDNLYGCNIESHQDGAATLLNAGAAMGTKSLYPVVGTELTLDLPSNASFVRVRDIANAIVIAAADVVIYCLQSGGPQYATLDFSGLPYDQYTIDVLDKNGLPVDDGKYPWTVLYLAQQADSMALLDILLMRPTSTSPGLYPVTLPADASTTGQCFDDVAYRLAFDARSTSWKYFVVSQDPASVLGQVQIHGKDAVFQQEPARTILPDGSSAIVFTSQSPLPLRQKSALHFQLTGQRRDANGHENPIKISRLPVAASAPVWPGQDQQSATGVSEIFVYV